MIIQETVYKIDKNGYSTINNRRKCPHRKIRQEKVITKLGFLKIDQ